MVTRTDGPPAQVVRVLLQHAALVVADRELVVVEHHVGQRHLGVQLRERLLRKTSSSVSGRGAPARAAVVPGAAAAAAAAAVERLGRAAVRAAAAAVVAPSSSTP